MAKRKTFDEPVKQFLSVLDESTEPQKEETAEPQSEPQAETEKPAAPKQSAAKPAAPKTAEAELAPIGYKLSPKFIEVKSKRLQLVLQPSLFRKVKRAALMEKTSVNEYIHKILERETQGV